MEKARINGAAEVGAWALRRWPISRVLETNFQCVGCDAEVRPCSFRLHNEVSPYFKIHGEHFGNCTLFTDVAAAGDSDHAATRSAPSTEHPVRLVDDTPRKVQGPQAANLPDGTDRRRRTRPQNAGTGQGARSAQSTTIERFVEWYWSATVDERINADIELPGVRANRFQYAFLNLENRPVTDRLESRIFHAPIRRIGELIDTDTHYRIELFAGDAFSKQHGGFDQPWTVVIDHSSWTDASRAKFERVYAAALSDARAHGHNYRFHVLGDQNPEQPNEILVGLLSRVYLMREH